MLSLPYLEVQGEKIRSKSFWVRLKIRSFTDYHHGQNRLGEGLFNLLPTKNAVR